MDLSLQINADEILKDIEADHDALAVDIQKGVEKLSIEAHAHITEQAAQKLHSRLPMWSQHFTADNLKQIDDHTWVITVPKEIVWIEEGVQELDMLKALLNGKKVKTAKDGSRYVVVPFRHSDPTRQRGPSRSSAFAKQLSNQVRGELKKRGIAYQKPLERDSSGAPKLGLLHAFDINNSPKKPHWTSPALQGVRVYQREVQDSKGNTSVRRDVMTFRVASSKHRGKKWMRSEPLEGMKFLDEALTWAAKEWSFTMLPEILAKYGIR